MKKALFVLCIFFVLVGTCCAEVVQSQIDGIFEGWTGETIVKLTDGQFWQQNDFINIDCCYSLNKPKVFITLSGGAYKMLVEGTQKTVSVIQLNGVIESQVDGDFNGWDGDTIVNLINGQVWKQNDSIIRAAALNDPKVIIYESGSGHQMKVDRIDKLVRVIQLSGPVVPPPTPTPSVTPSPTPTPTQTPSPTPTPTMTPTPPSGKCIPSVDENLVFQIPYLSYSNPIFGTISLWVNFAYVFNPKLILFKLTDATVIKNPFVAIICVKTVLSDELKIHIPDVLISDESTHLWLDLEYSPTYSTDGNVIFVVTNYGVISN
jgi:hypothetical protein